MQFNKSTHFPTKHSMNLFRVVNHTPEFCLVCLVKYTVDTGAFAYIGYIL